EPELATLSGNAQVVDDTSASGGKSVQFNAPPVNPPPPPPPTPPPTGRTCPGKPDARRTGVTPGVVLAVVTGDQTYSSSANGQTFSGKDFKGFVKVTGANITFKDCKFEGRATPYNNALIDTSESTGTITIQDSEFVPSNP